MPAADVPLLPRDPGTYVLWIALDAAITLNVGRLGAIRLPAGLYAYVGSARGPGGLHARVSRHQRSAKPTHWHIDSLTAVAPVVEVWYRVSPARLECHWAGALSALPGATTPVPGFGASDCACRAHLVALPESARAAAWETLGRPARVTFCARP